MKSRLSLCYLFVSYLLLTAAPAFAWGQAPLQPTPDGIGSGGVTADTSKRKEDASAGQLKFSGYIQALYQKASAKGIESFSGGAFEEDTDQRFRARRGRLKSTYTAGASQAVLQIDVTERGVAVRDAYILFKETKWNTFGLQAGLQSREFGHEVALSSSKRESPERSRLVQTLFAGERDAGVKLIIAPPDGSALDFLQVEGGFYNGSGPGSDYDNNKDFIGRIHTQFEGERASWTLGLGASVYLGGQRQNSRYTYTMASDNSSYLVDSSETNIGKTAERRYVGADIQAGYDFSFGKTTLRGEYVIGKQPGSSNSSRTPRSRPEEATYYREFQGAYLILVQELGRSPLNAIVKYDFYDPNRHVNGNALDNAFTEGDVLFHTWGYGIAWDYDKHVTFTAYYEDVRNETTQLAGFGKDISDNVLTLQIQYKF